MKKQPPQKTNEKQTSSSEIKIPSLPHRKILIAGIEETGLDGVVEMALKANQKFLPPLTYFRIPEMESGKNFSQLSQKRESFYRKFAKIQDKQGHVVLSSPLISPSSMGYVPTMPESFFSSFKPDLVILLEADPREYVDLSESEYGIIRRKKEWSEIQLEQELNRHMAIRVGAPIKVLPVQRGNVKKTLKELKDILLVMFRE